MEKRHTHHQFLTLSSPTGRPKFTTRHLAALDFLLHVPMSREAEIRHVGLVNASKARQLEENEDPGEGVNETGSDNVISLTTPLPLAIEGMNDEHVNAMSEFAAKKLKGPQAPVGKLSTHLRTTMSKITDQSALVRQWEDQLLKKKAIHTVDTSGNGTSGEQPLLDSRLFFSRARSYPLMVCSIIKYDAVEEKARLEKMKADDQKGLEVFDLPHRDWRGFSYKPLFKQLQEDSNGYLFDPDSLDDPHMRFGAHRYVSTRSAATGPILSSVILYVNKDKLRDSLNEQFHERHPSLPPSLTLSKIRNIKKKTLLFCLRAHIELSTAALAVINFERLCLRGYVSKINRKLSMAVSLLLAYKFCENYSQRNHKTFEILLDFLDKEWGLPRKQVFEAEFGAYVHLGLTLHVPYQQLHLVYTRLLKMANLTSKQYLGDEMLELMRRDILEIETEKEQVRVQREREDEEQQQQQHFAEQQQQQQELQDSNGDVSGQNTETSVLDTVNNTSSKRIPFWPMTIRKAVAKS